MFNFDLAWFLAWLVWNYNSEYHLARWWYCCIIAYGYGCLWLVLTAIFDFFRLAFKIQNNLWKSKCELDWVNVMAYIFFFSQYAKALSKGHGMLFLYYIHWKKTKQDVVITERKRNRKLEALQVLVPLGSEEDPGDGVQVTTATACSAGDLKLDISNGQEGISSGLQFCHIDIQSYHWANRWSINHRSHLEI